ncbi:outer membrane protein assembly factor BamB [Sulfurivirga sp.]|uniref:outer membrane protein assembly factor BamB n=1 Tax=Sulfurivirga sp. TaxID=2614236 RepID=UPI0025FE8F62|nr:outer membrane protein assembly factor BamB [Sulfurivirga sp.]
MRLFLTVLLLALLAGCGHITTDDGETLDWTPVVDRAGQKLVEGEHDRNALPGIGAHNPVAARLVWTLYYKPLNSADTRGLQWAEDGQRLYLAMPNGMVTAFYREEQPTWASQVAWQTLLSSPVLAGPIKHGDVLYVGTADGQLVALNARNGEVVWNRQLSSSIDAALVPAGDRLIVRTLDSKVYAVRLADGGTLWKTDHEAPPLALQGESAPVVTGGKVVVGWENGLLEALDLTNGEPLWQRRLATPSGRTDLERMVDVQAQPLLVNGRLYAVAFNGRLAALDPDTGALVWVKDFSSYRDMVALDDRLVALDDEGDLFAFDLITGTRIWEQKALRHRQLTDLRLWPLARKVVTGDRAGLIHFVEPLNGALWGRLRHHSHPIADLMMLSDHQMVVVDNEGYLSLYEVRLADE